MLTRRGGIPFKFIYKRLNFNNLNHLETYFRLSKTSWGILIGCKGDFVENPDVKLLNNTVEIVEGIYFELNISESNKFIHSNKILLENGIRWIINNKPLEKEILIRLNEIDMNFCNFQLEGLFFAIAKWICEYYNVAMPTYYVSYSKDFNKYIFSFEDGNEFSKKLLYPDDNG